MLQFVNEVHRENSYILSGTLLVGLYRGKRKSYFVEYQSEKMYLKQGMIKVNAYHSYDLYITQPERALQRQLKYYTYIKT